MASEFPGEKFRVRMFCFDGQHIGYFTVQYIVLHPLFSTKAFLVKFINNFEEKSKRFFKFHK